MYVLLGVSACVRSVRAWLALLCCQNPKEKPATKCALVQDVAGDGAIVGIFVGIIVGIIVGVDGACCAGDATRTVNTSNLGKSWYSRGFGTNMQLPQEFSDQSVASTIVGLGVGAIVVGVGAILVGAIVVGVGAIITVGAPLQGAEGEGLCL